jgi:hypothetical protein
MWRHFVAVLGFCAAVLLSATCAAEVNCGKVHKQAEQGSAGFYPRRSYSVEGKGRIYFHTAPDTRCRTKDIFVIQGDSLVVYSSFDGWYEVMYINPKSGEDYSGWVRSERLKFSGTIGPSQ